ncbi:DUF2764 family protein [Lentimicrobium sp.]|uniref:DUF2764 family protein n=1 Tax=Lentimicrobium sp. TaxID=2034841 RepID=UPI002BBEB050|nr:DUF2764 family protein [Lentimicrobium sp.]MCO5261677.1 DUF2764 domain-containing protein [Lentimicrobium sp.]HPF64016.1 DUF2764 family protein [Lentimicrobium sp.]HRW69198.1 DUF2764 family protein [Lentimicrobium sp.]
MIRNKYYYLVAGLPEITLEQGKLQFSTEQLREELKQDLSPEDFRLFEMLFLAEDNSNLLSLLLKEDRPLSAKGVYQPEMLAAEIKEPRTLMNYMRLFIESLSAENRLYPSLSPQNELTLLYYREMLEVKNNFMRSWFGFELNLRNVLLVLSAKKNGLPYENQVIAANSLADSMRRSSARDLGLASEWPWIDRLLQIIEIPDLLQREKAIDMLRWNFLDEQNTFNYFTVEVLIAFYIKLGIIERWLRLDPATGEELFRNLLGTLQNSYEFPNEFNIKDGRK